MTILIPENFTWPPLIVPSSLLHPVTPLLSMCGQLRITCPSSPQLQQGCLRIPIFTVSCCCSTARRFLRRGRLSVLDNLHRFLFHWAIRCVVSRVLTDVARRRLPWCSVVTVRSLSLSWTTGAIIRLKPFERLAQLINRRLQAIQFFPMSLFGLQNTCAPYVRGVISGLAFLVVECRSGLIPAAAFHLPIS